MNTSATASSAARVRVPNAFWVVGWRGRRVAGSGRFGEEGRTFPGIQVRATIICPQNRDQSVLLVLMKPILIAWTHFFSLFDALYLRNGCPTDKSEQRKWGKAGGMGKCLEAIDLAGSRSRPAF